MSSSEIYKLTVVLLHLMDTFFFLDLSSGTLIVPHSQMTEKPNNLKGSQAGRTTQHYFIDKRNKSEESFF
jgi:hypothetical protein